MECFWIAAMRGGWWKTKNTARTGVFEEDG